MVVDAHSVETMIDEIFEAILDVIVELVPQRVLQAVLVVAGLVATAVGVLLLGESPQLGAVVTVVGALVVIASVFFW